MQCDLAVEVKAGLSGLGFILTDIMIGVLRGERKPGGVVGDLEDALKLIGDLESSIPDACSGVREILADVKRYVILSRCVMMYIAEKGFNSDVLMEALLWLAKAVQKTITATRYY